MKNMSDFSKRKTLAAFNPFIITSAEKTHAFTSNCVLGGPGLMFQAP